VSPLEKGEHLLTFFKRERRMSPFSKGDARRAEGLIVKRFLKTTFLKRTQVFKRIINGEK
jgi:hypothetical protein